MQNRQTARRPIEAEILHLDDVLLEACGPELRGELLTEAAMLAEAFAPEGRTEQLRAMAETLASGARDEEMDRARARLLACALRRLARYADS
jgi:hypothetical protein